LQSETPRQFQSHTVAPIVVNLRTITRKNLE
jgi:hypothetical protein